MDRRRPTSSSGLDRAGTAGRRRDGATAGLPGHKKHGRPVGGLGPLLPTTNRADTMELGPPGADRHERDADGGRPARMAYNPHRHPDAPAPVGAGRSAAGDSDVRGRISGHIRPGPQGTGPRHSGTARRHTATRDIRSARRGGHADSPELPLRLPHHQGCSAANGPQPRRVGAAPRSRRGQHVLQADAPAAAPGDGLWIIACRSLYAERLRSGVALEIRVVHVGHISAVPGSLRQIGRRRPGSGPGRACRGRAADREPGTQRQTVLQNIVGL